MKITSRPCVRLIVLAALWAGTTCSNDSPLAPPEGRGTIPTGGGRLNLAACTEPPSGLVSWWPGEGNANDIQGGHNGTLNGGVTFVAGEVAQAFNLGGGSFVSVPHSANHSPAQITVDAWVNSADGNNGVIASKYGGLYNGWILEWSTNAVYFYLYLSSTTSSAGGVSVTPNAWTHIAATYDGSAIRLYVNGVLQNTVPYTGGYTSTTVPMTMGAASWNTGFSPEWFSGAVDELEIFSRALSQAEIQAIYNAGTAGKCKTDTDGDGTINSADTDDDDDGIVDTSDNCPIVANPGQEDLDADGVGDACDNCVATPNADQVDGDADGVGDACDNCPADHDPDQWDTDSDGTGDQCEENGGAASGSGSVRHDADSDYPGQTARFAFGFQAQSAAGGSLGYQVAGHEFRVAGGIHYLEVRSARVFASGWGSWDGESGWRFALIGRDDRRDALELRFTKGGQSYRFFGPIKPGGLNLRE